jgi:uncharacterized OB-fold protein
VTTSSPSPPQALSPPRPAPDPLTEPFWQGAAEGRLVIQRCCRCHRYIHPPRPVCRFCLSTRLEPTEVSGRATLYTWTVAEQAFHPFFADKLPYVYATVDLVEQPGLRLITNIVDVPFEELRVDMALEVVFREVAEGLVLPLFRPTE